MNTLLRPMNALLLIGLAFGQGRLARILSTKPIVYLGKASYAMYILHIPILWWAVSWPDFAVRYLYVPFVIAISCVVYTLIEEPANQFLRARKENRNRTEWALRQAA
jgi:peptidoglycan/LPS O-acetylase OafA/YrhL